MGLHKIERTILEGPQLVFDCPKCGTAGAVANTQDVRERFLSFHLIPLLRARYTLLTCANCGTTLRMDQSVDRLTSLPPDRVTHLLQTRIPILIRLCVVCGLVLSPLPVFGLVFSASGLAGTARRPSGWRSSSIIGLSLSVICNVAFVILLCSGRPQPQPFPARHGEFPTTQRMPMPPTGTMPPAPLGQRQPFGPRRTYNIGDKVDARWAGAWRPGQVVELRGPFLHIRFDDQQQPREVTLPPELVRPRKE